MSSCNQIETKTSILLEFTQMRNLPTNCLNMFDHFVGLTLKGLKLIAKSGGIRSNPRLQIKNNKNVWPFSAWCPLKGHSRAEQCKIYSKLTMKILEQRQWQRSGVFIVNFGQISRYSSASIVDFEQVNVGWGGLLRGLLTIREMLEKILDAIPFLQKYFRRGWFLMDLARWVIIVLNNIEFFKCLFMSNIYISLNVGIASNPKSKSIKETATERKKGQNRRGFRNWKGMIDIPQFYSANFEKIL